MINDDTHFLFIKAGCGAAHYVRFENVIILVLKSGWKICKNGDLEHFLGRFLDDGGWWVVKTGMILQLLDGFRGGHSHVLCSFDTQLLLAAVALPVTFWFLSPFSVMILVVVHQHQLLSFWRLPAASTTSRRRTSASMLTHSAANLICIGISEPSSLLQDSGFSASSFSSKLSASQPSASQLSVSQLSAF